MCNMPRPTCCCCVSAALQHIHSNAASSTKAVHAAGAQQPLAATACKHDSCCCPCWALCFIAACTYDTACDTPTKLICEHSSSADRRTSVLKRTQCRSQLAYAIHWLHYVSRCGGITHLSASPAALTGAAAHKSPVDMDGLTQQLCAVQPLHRLTRLLFCGVLNQGIALDVSCTQRGGTHAGRKRVSRAQHGTCFNGNSNTKRRALHDLDQADTLSPTVATLLLVLVSLINRPQMWYVPWGRRQAAARPGNPTNQNSHHLCCLISQEWMIWVIPCLVVAVILGLQQIAMLPLSSWRHRAEDLLMLCMLGTACGADLSAGLGISAEVQC